MSAEGAPQQPAGYPAQSAGSLSYVDGTGQLSVSVQHPADTVSVIHVAGELDMLTGPLLQDHLDRLLATQPERLIVDLSQVSFIGSTGLAILISTKHTAQQQGTALQLRGTSHRVVARPLEITGLDRLFDIVPPERQL